MYANNIRSPNNIFVACWFLVLGIIFLLPFDVSADCGSYYPSEDVAKLDLEDSDVSYYWNLYLETCRKWSSEDNSFIVLRSDVDKNEYNQVYYFLIKWRGNLSFQNFDFRYSSSSSNNVAFYFSDLNKDKFRINRYSNFYNGDSSNFGCTFYSCGLSSVNINNVKIIYCNIRESDTLNGYPDELPKENYDINDLKSYPVDSINVTSPVTGSNIKTNGRFVNVAIKGKIGIDCTDDIAVTKEDLGKLIRNNFRYSFNSDNESFNNVSYLGPVIETSRGQSPDDDILDILQVLGNEFPIVKGEQIKIAPLNDNWIIGVSGNTKDWSSKKYYNFVINTALYVGENDGDYNYKLNFKVPVGFGMNITYKTITVDYKLSRGSYVDDDFNGIDDNTNEIIPAEEIEIINPSTSTPVLPSDDGLDDGLQVVSILKDIYKDFCNGVNGAANILKSFFSVVNSTVQSVVNYSEEMVISFSNIFSFMPSPVPQLITMSLAIMIFVSVLGFIKK